MRKCGQKEIGSLFPKLENYKRRLGHNFKAQGVSNYVMLSPTIAKGILTTTDPTNLFTS